MPTATLTPEAKPTSAQQNTPSQRKQCPEHWVIRPIEQRDNAALNAIFWEVFKEYGIDKLPGTASEDAEITNMYEGFTQPLHAYWVAEDQLTGEILGGAGVGPLKGTNFETDGICEFQKSYLKKKARGFSLGTQILELRLAWAKAQGFKYGYMETRHGFRSPELFTKYGFEFLPAKLGDNGHHAMHIFMGRSLI
jgi:putative acetyltransferase